MLFGKFHSNDAYHVGIDRLVVIASPKCNEFITGYMRENTLKLKNLTLRMADNFRFPQVNPNYKKSVPFGEIDEITMGVLMSYVNFYKTEISGLNISAMHNGEVTLIDSEDCDHQKITDCYLYLNNWNDRTVGEWKRQREQGANLNVRGDNKSVLIANNTFIKHGNDEALTFFPGGNSSYTGTCIHENIKVINNSFTYLDADPVSDSSENGPIVETRPVHTNVVLITFNPTDNVRSEWKNLLFSENTIRLEGPNHTAVSMSVIPGDTWSGVKFSNNTLYHTYRYNGLKPGNDARLYIYTKSFMFTTLKDASDLSLNHSQAQIPSTAVDEPATKTGPVEYCGNSIYYSQHTQDLPDLNNFVYAYEHSCFAVQGGSVYIHDNYIDGTAAVVQRIDSANGKYGKEDNPISLFHCMPCEVEGNYDVRICRNYAIGYGVALRCRPQYNTQDIISGYSVRMEGNSLHDGAAIVLYNLNNSNISVVRNSFTECTAGPLIYAQTPYKDIFLQIPQVTVSVFQNKFEAEATANKPSLTLLKTDISNETLSNNVSVDTDTLVKEYCFILNYLPGYTTFVNEPKPSHTQFNCSNNLAPSDDSENCGS